LTQGIATPLDDLCATLILSDDRKGAGVMRKQTKDLMSQKCGGLAEDGSKFLKETCENSKRATSEAADFA